MLKKLSFQEKNLSQLIYQFILMMLQLQTVMFKTSWFIFRHKIES